MINEVIHSSFDYDIEPIYLNEDMSNKLFCTFATEETLDSILEQKCPYKSCPSTNRICIATLRPLAASKWPQHLASSIFEMQIHSVEIQRIVLPGSFQKFRFYTVSTTYFVSGFVDLFSFALWAEYGLIHPPLLHLHPDHCVLQHGDAHESV